MTAWPGGASTDAEGGGSATNDNRPLRCRNHPSAGRSSVSTISRRPSEPTPPEPDPRFEMARWLFGDRCPAGWVLVYLIVVLSFALAVVWVLAPHLGELASALAGG